MGGRLRVHVHEAVSEYPRGNASSELPFHEAGTRGVVCVVVLFFGESWSPHGELRCFLQRRAGAAAKVDVVRLVPQSPETRDAAEPVLAELAASTQRHTVGRPIIDEY